MRFRIFTLQRIRQLKICQQSANRKSDARTAGVLGESVPAKGGAVWRLRIRNIDVGDDDGEETVLWRFGDKFWAVLRGGPCSLFDGAQVRASRL